ncbi:presenilin-like protein At1g08700 [Mangifera indica]|uniref:presenilin-like protein At1g08700 n=1 Tax=Mangifera indica TaxID=29780 RepID=UPI001CF9E622|nr:presenilin-like protein At1g08700 [Mangifera indica]
MESSILESVGAEIIGVMSPVSLCMLLVVLLVYSLSSSNPLSDLPIRTAANLVYIENHQDSTAQKLEGAILNALVFVVLTAIVTFLHVILYYYNFTNFLKNYTRFASFFILGLMGGSIFLSIIQHYSIPVDSITFFLLLFNLTVVGVLSLFSDGMPIMLRQGYTVCLGIIAAAWFTKLPEWTTWAVLVGLAVYDLVAVLAPGGPLKLLVELSSSRDEEPPALLYEARPTVSSSGRNRRLSMELLVGGVSDSESEELQVLSRESVHRTERVEHDRNDDAVERLPLVCRLREEYESSSGSSSEYSPVFVSRQNEISVDKEMSPLVDMMGLGSPTSSGCSEDGVAVRGGIKLGLGDFVFYSVLAGRAAMYDLITVYACYLAIISGLGCTLILLSVCRQALPALPISITLGILFYFLTRLLLEPFVVSTATNLMMF